MTTRRPVRIRGRAFRLPEPRAAVGVDGFIELHDVSCPEKLSAAAARRIALAAQGLHRRRPDVTIGRASLARQIERLGLVQIDSVTAVRPLALPAAVLAARCLPATALLDELAYGGRRRRGCSSIGATRRRCCRCACSRCCAGAWRGPRDGQGIYGGLARFARERAPSVDDVLEEVARAGPLAAGELARGRPGRGRLVGLERRQDGARVPVLGRRRSPPPPGAASSGSTTCPSACCRRQY